ncbi:MAG: hypothetical protein U1E56_13820 [Bauldia sp.]
MKAGRGLSGVLAAAACGLLAGCLGGAVGPDRTAALSPAPYPNINEAPATPAGHLMTPDEAAAEAARVRSLGETARARAGGTAAVAAMSRSAAALQSRGAAQAAAAKAELACRVAPGQPKPRGCP